MMDDGLWIMDYESWIGLTMGDWWFIIDWLIDWLECNLDFMLDGLIDGWLINDW